MPRLAGATFGDARAADDGRLTADWRLRDGARLSLIANLSPRAITGPPADMTGTIIWGSATGGPMPPWLVLWRIGAP